MPFCEICGNECHRRFKRKIEGAIMNVCPNCKNMGKPLKSERKKRIRRQSKRRSTGSSPYGSPQRRKRPRKRKPYRKNKKISNLKLRKDYRKRLINYRNKKGLSRDEFADSLKIARSYYRRIEKGTTALPIKLARRLEKNLKLKLVEKEETVEKEDLKKYLKQNKKSGG